MLIQLFIWQVWYWRQRWSKKRLKLIRDSRIIPTENLSKIVAGLDQPPKKILLSSAIGYYGNRGTEKLVKIPHPEMLC